MRTYNFYKNAKTQLNDMKKLKAEGLTEKEIATEFGFEKVMDLRLHMALCRLLAKVKDKQDAGMRVSEIASWIKACDRVLDDPGEPVK